VKIIVTGANGFIGAQVVRLLSAGVDEVYAIVRGTSDRHRIANLPNVRVLEADILTDGGRARIVELGAEACVHCAWYAVPGTYLASSFNVAFMQATLTLAGALATSGCRRFVGLGTCFEYDTDAGYLSERTPLAPTHLYSATKAGTYFVLRQLASATGMHVAWARLFYLYGPDEYPSRLVPSIARALLRGDEAKSTQGLQVRDFLHVEDAASAICAILYSDIRDAVNVASGRPVTVESIAREVSELCGRPDLLRLGAIPHSDGDPRFVCADIRKLSSATDWKPRWPMKEGLAQTVAWWREADRGAVIRVP
jgi:nucleoside-diphosphate-sugar epimerase